jgi:hypothetical protein
MSFTNMEMAVETAKLDADIAKGESTQLCNAEKKRRSIKERYQVPLLRLQRLP